MDKIGERLKQCRLASGLTQHEIATKLNLTSRSTICKYETGAYGNMTIGILKKFADLYGVSPAYLLGWSSLTLEEEKLINIYRQNDETYRKMLEMIIFNYSQSAKEGNENAERKED